MLIEHPRTRRGGGRLRCLLPLLLLGLVLLGCDGDEEEDAAAPATTTAQSAPASPTETAEPDPAADKRIAEESGLVLEDFPSGWQENDEDPDRVSRCAAIQEARETTSARGGSPRFSRHNNNTSAESVTYVYAEEPAAAEAFAQLATAETRSCLADDARDVLEEDGSLEVGEPETARVAMDPLGDERDASRITFPVTSEGTELDVFADYVVVRAGRGLALLTFIDVLSPFDEELGAELTSRVVRRLSSGLD